MGVLATSLALLGVGSGLVFVQQNNVGQQLSESQMNPKGFEPYHDSIGTIVRFSNEENYPFRSSGKTLAQINRRNRSPFARRMAPIVEDFPSVLSCLKSGQQYSKEPDLSQVDWQKINSQDQASVCLFRIAASYGEVDDFANWLRGQGFFVYPFHDYGSNGWKRLDATRSSQIFRGGFFDLIFDHSMSVTAFFNAHGLWVQVHVGITRK